MDHSPADTPNAPVPRPDEFPERPQARVFGIPVIFIVLVVFIIIIGLMAWFGLINGDMI